MKMIFSLLVFIWLSFDIWAYDIFKYTSLGWNHTCRLKSVVCTFVGVFILVYLICLFLFGIPVLLLECAMGQMSGGVMGYWRFCPLIRGIEYLSTWTNAYGTPYYFVYVSYITLYLMYCFQSELPWKNCHHSWATKSKCKNCLAI